MKKFLALFFGIIIISFGINSVEGSSLTSRIIPVSIWDVVYFEGRDWLGYHVVKIIITSDDGFIDTLKVKTSQDGKLSVPWIIPSQLPSGNYLVFATDRVNNATTNFEI